MSDWTTIFRNRGVDFKTWQTLNLKIVDYTWSNWSTFTDSERVIVMKGLQRIVPKSALRGYSQGNTFDLAKLRNSEFEDILSQINIHNEDYKNDFWASFDAKLSVAKPADTRALNL